MAHQDCAPLDKSCTPFSTECNSRNGPGGLLKQEDIESFSVYNVLQWSVSKPGTQHRESPLSLPHATEVL
jgi:hypothetical protein